MVLLEAVPEEYEEVKNILTPQGLWQSFNGDEYDVCVIKVNNVLKLQDLWHFIVEEDFIDPKILILWQNSKKKEVKLFPYVSYKTI